MTNRLAALMLVEFSNSPCPDLKTGTVILETTKLNLETETRIFLSNFTA